MLERFEAKRVLVVGLGRFGGGVGVTRWLAGQGAAVTVTALAWLESLPSRTKVKAMTMLGASK